MDKTHCSEREKKEKIKILILCAAYRSKSNLSMCYYYYHIFYMFFIIITFFFCQRFDNNKEKYTPAERD